MANPENLIGHEFTSDQDREEAAKNGRKGGRASGKKRRERKLMREIFEDMLKRKYTNAQGQEMDGATIMCMKQFQKALDGDLKAFTEIRDMVGEQVVQRIEIDTIDPSARAEMDELLGIGGDGE